MNACSNKDFAEVSRLTETENAENGKNGENGEQTKVYVHRALQQYYSHSEQLRPDGRILLRILPPLMLHKFNFSPNDSRYNE